MKVLLVDDHPLILTALQTLINSIGSEARVVGTESAAAARAALQAANDYDLVLLDLALGDADGFDVLAEFRRDYPSLPVVVVSASERASDVIRAIDLGAMGFVPKSSSHAELHEALRMVMSGSMYVPPSMLGLDFARERAQPEADTSLTLESSPGEIETSGAQRVVVLVGGRVAGGAPLEVPAARTFPALGARLDELAELGPEALAAVKRKLFASKAS